jgi:hypothetical protein
VGDRDRGLTLPRGSRGRWINLSLAEYREMVDRYGQDATIEAIKIVSRKDRLIGKAHRKGAGDHLLIDKEQHARTPAEADRAA